MFFLSRRWRPNKWPFYGLLLLELPLTVALLALFGIAAPNLYRTKLWQDGADNGFNSSPTTGLYAAANYRPYTTPKVWSQFITNYNVVIAVLSMFIMLVKSIMYMLHVFPPVLSTLVHAILIALYTVSVYYQASSDTTDPKHPQRGAPWYITKSCSVAHDKSLVGYCQQAKASFACTCAMQGVFVVYFGFAVWSCFPTKLHKAEYAEEQRLKAGKRFAFERLGDYDPESGRIIVRRPQPDTPGFQPDGVTPITPRTKTFNILGGIKDVPRRNPFNTPKTTATTKAPSFALRSPELPRSPMSPGFIERAGVGSGDVRTSKTAEEKRGVEASNPASPQLFFPPPPKIAKK
ncbi:hypothetical protein HRR83_008316 [Exophiala dermatitidis]|uniref:Uncharacterized protein n=2 Tax=Exophiala dermatitidis TaxID=5970 RepID=H6C568_EXODN|nr:uncharacterized protein HMPREF1120_07762 [Exophiala dermatitidis NIH/UT8656]KAJ4505469.1 hypothetical protein HRR75_007338 [Exophiala dermatitidis]EHY59780.1 hypothetical protein HMPREF1120_07762 [Exophiala dermatitidis NIH/UT8656]KAJ4507072.1 hypothetical protein HRR73_007893 [Exophiala dermatitidis]KAJ4507668.1 hypothetical protein HRR74_007995 [Exophiala dermatitidis]KAJ4535237.1 hypothetical protein HRR77_008148 [Exophiala dermatitidis]